MEDAFYAMYFTGQHGSGLGLLAFVGGVVVGADVVGGRFDGTYTVDEGSGTLTGSIKMTVPANSTLVTGQAPRDQPYTVELPISMSSDLGGGQTMQLELPIGLLNVRFEKLRDFPKT